jgi:hypothetical protein
MLPGSGFTLATKSFNPGKPVIKIKKKGCEIVKKIGLI